MIEAIVRTYLEQKLSAECSMEMPESGDKFIIVEKTGGGYKNHIATAIVTVKSYGKSMYEAATLNEQVITAMLEMAELNEICKISLNSDYNFTDTNQKHYRYQAIFDIKYYPE